MRVQASIQTAVDLFPRKLAALTPETRLFLQEQRVELMQHKIDLDYDYWTAGAQQ